MQPQAVMAGLDPAIHVLATSIDGTGNRVDARVNPAHDGFGWALRKTRNPLPFPRQPCAKAGIQLRRGRMAFGSSPRLREGPAGMTISGTGVRFSAY
jgi:hypothetical protein